MTETAAKRKRPNYGIDAPAAVRNLILGGFAALVLAVILYLFDWGLTRMATASPSGGWRSQLEGLGQQRRQAFLSPSFCSDRRCRLEASETLRMDGACWPGMAITGWKASRVGTAPLKRSIADKSEADSDCRFAHGRLEGTFNQCPARHRIEVPLP